MHNQTIDRRVAGLDIKAVSSYRDRLKSLLVLQHGL